MQSLPILDTSGRPITINMLQNNEAVSIENGNVGMNIPKTKNLDTLEEIHSTIGDLDVNSEKMELASIESSTKQLPLSECKTEMDPLSLEQRVQVFQIPLENQQINEYGANSIHDQVISQQNIIQFEIPATHMQQYSNYQIINLPGGSTTGQIVYKSNELEKSGLKPTVNNEQELEIQPDCYVDVKKNVPDRLAQLNLDKVI